MQPQLSVVDDVFNLYALSREKIAQKQAVALLIKCISTQDGCDLTFCECNFRANVIRRWQRMGWIFFHDRRLSLSRVPDR